MVLTLAGCGEQGYRDGPGRRARFRYLQGIAVDKTGNVLVSERFNHRIRQVAPDGTVTTLAGSGKEGCTDGHDAFYNISWSLWQIFGWCYPFISVPLSECNRSHYCDGE
eukprot:m.577840 g.577840  ORF g.577840 m.577840 type:complete len:109 (-) comp22300_c0_seq14:54-380(-)